MSSILAWIRAVMEDFDCCTNRYPSDTVTMSRKATTRIKYFEVRFDLNVPIMSFLLSSAPKAEVLTQIDMDVNVPWNPQESSSRIKRHHSCELFSDNTARHSSAARAGLFTLSSNLYQFRVNASLRWELLIHLLALLNGRGFQNVTSSYEAPPHETPPRCSLTSASELMLMDARPSASVQPSGGTRSRRSSRYCVVSCPDDFAASKCICRKWRVGTFLVRRRPKDRRVHVI